MGRAGNSGAGCNVHSPRSPRSCAPSRHSHCLRLGLRCPTDPPHELRPDDHHLQQYGEGRRLSTRCSARMHSLPHSPSLWFARSQEQRPRIQTRATQRPVFERLGEPTAAQMLDQFKPSASSRPSRSTSPLPRLAGQPVAVQPDEADQLVERGGLCDNPHSPGGLGARCAGSGAIGRAQGGDGEHRWKQKRRWRSPRKRSCASVLWGITPR